MWLTQCLDPYHDYTLESRGLPDERSAPSVVQVHNQTCSITIPTSAAGGNWDCSILYSGFNALINQDTTCGGMVTVPTSSGVSYSSAALSSGQPFAALNIWAGAASSVNSTGSPYTVGDSYSALGSVLGTDRCRLISVGFEVHNTTAEIYRQGSLTVAQLPDCAADSAISIYHDTVPAWDIANFQNDRALMQASTLAPLLSVPGSQTWPASEGCYCIPRMTFVPRDINSFLEGTSSGGVGANTRVPVLYGTDGKTALPIPSGSVVWKGVNRIPLHHARYPSGFSPIQVICSGLSAQTTLTLTFRTVVEYFPALTSPLLPLGSPSPVFDPLAFELYGKLVSGLPYAVQVKDNAAGDYFRKVLMFIARVMNTSAPLFGEFGPLVKIGSSLALDRLGAYPVNPNRK